MTTTRLGRGGQSAARFPAGSIFGSCGETMSANTGRAPSSTVMLAAATKIERRLNHPSSPGPTPTASNCQVQGRGSIAHGHGMVRAHRCGERRLEPGHFPSPIVSHWLRSTRSTAASSSAP